MFGEHDCNICYKDKPIEPKEGKIGERIIAAALWYPDLEFPYHDKWDIDTTYYLPRNIKHGVVFCSRNHLQSMWMCYQIFGKTQNEMNEIDGFLTSENRFVDRDEAGEIAFRAGQMDRVKHLFSEDLFED